jgi:hypothetical protein
LNFITPSWHNRRFVLTIAPFEGASDPNRGGWIRHGELNQTDLLESIGADVRNICNMENFKPTWAYMVTYFEQMPRLDSFDAKNRDELDNLKNTYQVLFVTNYNVSFVMLNYVRMEWPNSLFAHKNFEAGFYFEDVTFQIKKKHLIENTSVSNLVENSNMGRPGRWFISFDNENCRLGYNNSETTTIKSNATTAFPSNDYFLYGFEHPNRIVIEGNPENGTLYRINPHFIE